VIQTLKKIPMNHKKQIGVRLRPELIEILNIYVKKANDKGIFISKNDVMESLVYSLKKELEDEN